MHVVTQPSRRWVCRPMAVRWGPQQRNATGPSLRSRDVSSRNTRRSATESMASQWIPVVGTLGGAVVGALAGLSAQLVKFRQDRATRWDASRKDTYAGFLADCE